MTALVDQRWGRTVVDNRWDLLPAPPIAPSVTVVVTYFEQQAELERVLAGLSMQRGHVELREVVVVDDGSKTAPLPPAHLRLADGTRVPVIVARQEDLGCRPAAARNIGASFGTGEVLVFLDGDMVPDGLAVARLAALPAVAGEALVVGRREYADFDGWSPAAVADWLAADRTGVGPTTFARPHWLDERYASSCNMLHLDHRSYQLIIGAIMAMSRTLFEELCGFDGGIDCYGGEDWEIAYRAYCAGAIFAHVPDAVGWHHGPDWRGREGRSATKNPERLMLQRTVPGAHDSIRGPSVRYAARLRAERYQWSDDQVLATLAALLDAGGTAVTVEVPQPSPGVARACEFDQRVRSAMDAQVTARSLLQIDVWAPLRCGPELLDDLLQHTGDGCAGRVTVCDEHGRLITATATRALSRARRWATDGNVDEQLVRLFGTSSASARSMGVERLHDSIDLDEVFPR